MISNKNIAKNHIMNIKIINKVMSLILIFIGGLLFFSDKYYNLLGIHHFATPYIFMLIGLIGLIFTSQLNVLNNITYTSLYLIGVSLFIYRYFEILDENKLIFYSWLIFPSCLLIKLGFDLDNNKKLYVIGLLYAIILFILNVFNQSSIEIIITEINYFLIDLFPIVLIVLGAYILSKNSN